MVKRIRVDGFKAVIIPPVKTQQEFIDLLNWREYKNRIGLRDMRAVAGGFEGVMILQAQAAYAEKVGAA